MRIGNKDLIITPASFDEAMDLKDAIEEAIKSGNIDIGFNDSADIDSFSLSDVSTETISSLIKTILSVDSSKEVRKNLFICAERSLIGTEKVDKNFFEKVENREYYYQIMFEILRVNLTPFYKGLFSKLSGLGILQKVKDTLKLK